MHFYSAVHSCEPIRSGRGNNSVRILFIQDNALDESQALVELAAFLGGQGHDCNLLLDRVERDITASARSYDPALIVVACSMLNHWWGRDVSARLHHALKQTPIIIGGTAPTVFPELLSEAPVDGLIRGEAEVVVKAVVDHLADGNSFASLTDVPGLFRWVDGELMGTPAVPGIDMHAIPLANKDIYYTRYPFMRQFPFKRFLTSRGCHHRCQYCYISTLNKVQPRQKGRKWTRRKSPEVAVAEVAREKHLGPLTHVHFSDDLFTNDKEWLFEFAPLYRREVGIPFTCNTSAELIDDDVAEALREAGCYSIGFAVETANAHIRNKVLRKGVKTDHLRRAAEALHRHQVKLATFNMLALPGESPDEALETARLNAQLRTDFVRLNFAFPMPGTGMSDYAMEHGFISQNWPDRFKSAEFRYTPGPQFRTPYRKEFENLFVLFRVASTNERLIPGVRRALRLNTPRSVQNVLTLQGAWNDKRNFRIPVLEGIKFFAKVGRPELRATNFPALI